MYQSITTLPLDRFIDCFVDGNLYALIISGKPDVGDVDLALTLKSTWDDILQQYSERVAGHEYKLYLSLLRELSILKINYDFIHNVCAEGNEEKGISTGILRFVYIKVTADEVNRILNTKCKFNYQDQKTYDEELNKCIRRTGSMKIKIDLKTMQFEAIKKKHESKDPGETKGRDYFISVLISLSDHVKYAVGDKITVFEYVERIERLNKYCEQLKNAVR